MIIFVSQISEDEGLTVHHLYPEGEPGLEGDESRLVGRPVLDLKATRQGDRVKLVGSVKAAVEIECDRCLTSLSVPVDQSFDLVYVPPNRPQGASDEKELGEDDLSVSFYQGQTIDLDELLREQVELALPMARLCSEQCKGLCPQCRANLNERQCQCTVEETDPRWAALKDLK
ncbi:MAG TPA: DUF177 domain-containing protein [Blastocatellia bacterium]|nr:DUF177 domain-containing protein [Blastocatellia bacterium]